MTRQRLARIGLSILTLLFLGAATSVGVAWFFATKAPWVRNRLVAADRVSYIDSNTRPARGTWVTRRCFGCEYIHAVYLPPPLPDDLAAQFPVYDDPFARKSFGVSKPRSPEYQIDAFTTIGPLPISRQLVGMIERASGYTEFMVAGWPARSVCSKSVYGDRNVTLGAIWFLGRRMPIIPLWPGAAINTAIYAAAWSPILLLTKHARRGRRKARGLCPGCGYDRRGLPTDQPPPCPECGEAARSLRVPPPLR